MKTDKEETIRRKHKQLFSIIGDNLPPKSQDFERFKQEIPLGPTSKKRHSASAEKLLEAWEVRGGISLGKYVNLLDLLERSGLLTLRRLIDNQIHQILQDYEDLSSDCGSADEPVFDEEKCVGNFVKVEPESPKPKTDKGTPDPEAPCTSTTETVHIRAKESGEVKQALDRIFETLVEIQAEQKGMYTYMSMMSPFTSIPTSLLSAESWITKTFPIKTMKGMEQVEASLFANKEFKPKLIQHLVTFQAETFTQDTQKKLTKLIAKNLAGKLNVSGKWKLEQRTFRTSPLYEILFDAVKQTNPEAIEKRFRDVVNRWFRWNERMEKQTKKPKNKGNQIINHQYSTPM